MDPAARAGCSLKLLGKLLLTISYVFIRERTPGRGAPGSTFSLPGADLKLSAAAMVHPNAVAIVSPAITEAARRFANLLHDLHSAASVYWAILASPKIR